MNLLGEAAECALVRRVARNDHLAMSRLALSYDARLSRFLRRFTRRQELVSEIKNDTMFVVWRQAGRFRFESRVSSWIFGIAYRCAMQAFRSENRLSVVDVHPEGQRCCGLIDEQEQFETIEWVGKALLELPLEQRTALELMYGAGYSCEEVGEMLGCPANTVKTRLFHARRKLRRALPVSAGLINIKVGGTHGQL